MYTKVIMVSNIIEVDNLCKVYDGVPAVDKVSFAVKKGEVIGFVGLNGAGKSTTINTMLGFLHPSSGSVKLFGELVVPQTAHNVHDRIGFASGDMSLFENLTGRQYFRFIARQFALKDTAQLDVLIDKFNPDLGKKIHDLSRGNRQKIALIAAFMMSPKLVILDEPSSGLDPLMQQVFIDLVREEAEKGTTIFMSSHYLGEVTDVCSRILLIRDGKLIKDISTSELTRGGGKIVKIVSKKKLQLPAKSTELRFETGDARFETDFVYKGNMIDLQNWMASLYGLIDITIVDHDKESAFEDLYAMEVKDV